MWKLIEKMKEVEREWSLKRGPFRLFTIVIRENAPEGLIDIVLSAAWITNEKTFLDEFTASLGMLLNPEEIMSISRIVVLDISEPFIGRFLQWFRPGETSAELHDTVVNGISIKHAYLLTSSMEEDSHAVLH